ncbi:MAG: AI-2E family transporter [Vibrio sp.]
MNTPEATQKSRFFVNNMLESAIRIGLLFVLVAGTYDIIKPFIIPVLWGAIIAVALMPLTTKMERLFKGRRGLATIVLTLIAIALLVTPFVLISSSIFEGIAHAKAIVQSGSVNIPGPSERIADIPVIGQKLYDTWSLFTTNLQQAVMQFLPQIKSLIGTLAGMFGNSLVTLLMSIISLLIAAGFMAKAESASAGLSKVAVKVVGKRAESWTNLTAATIRSVLLGVVGVAFIQSLLVGSALMTFHVPGAGLLALAVLILGIAQLPAIIIILPVAIYVMSTYDTTPATICTIWLVIAAISDNFLKPMLMGRGVDVPMPVILIGAIGGMLYAGIIGLFLGAVVLSIWYELFVSWLNTEEPAAVAEPETESVK